MQILEPNAWRVVWQKAHQAPYMFRDNKWVAYDDDNSLQLKVIAVTTAQPPTQGFFFFCLHAQGQQMGVL